MTNKVTATITFILHEGLDNGSEEDNREALVDCLENERVGIAQYKSVKVDAFAIVGVEDE